MSDPYADYVVFDAGLDSLPFSDAKGKTVNVQGNVRLNTTNPVVGSGCADLSASYGNKLWTPNHADFSFGTGDFCVEAWGYIVTLTDWNILIATALAYEGWDIQVTRAGVVSAPVSGYSGSNETDGSVVASPAGLVSTGKWHHYAVSRYRNRLTLFLDGMPIAKTTNATNIRTTSILGIGNDANNNTTGYWLGYVDGARITKGAARYTGPFDPFTGEPLNIKGVVKGQPIKPYYSNSVPTTTHAACRSVSDPRMGNPQYYGRGFIAGTVKVEGRPNHPVYRETWLLDQRTAMLVSKTWSDPVTGAYRFEHLDERRKYTVIAYDYEHNFRAVIADNITPESVS